MAEPPSASSRQTALASEKRKMVLGPSQLVDVLPLQIVSTKVAWLTVVNIQASADEVLEEVLVLQTGDMPTFRQVELIRSGERLVAEVSTL